MDNCSSCKNSDCFECCIYVCNICGQSLKGKGIIFKTQNYLLCDQCCYEIEKTVSDSSGWLKALFMKTSALRRMEDQQLVSGQKIRLRHHRIYEFDLLTRETKTGSLNIRPQFEEPLVA